jgi:hypothetical protein
MGKATARNVVAKPTGFRPDESTARRREVSVEDFLRSAHLCGVIEENSYRRLVKHYVGLTSAKEGHHA